MDAERRAELESRILSEAENYIDGFTSNSYIATGMTDDFIDASTPGRHYIWDTVRSIDKVEISAISGGMWLRFTRNDSVEHSASLPNAIFNMHARQLLEIRAHEDGVDLPNVPAAPANATAAILSAEEIRRHILEYNLEHIPNLNDIPRVAAGFKPGMRSIGSKHGWTDVEEIKVAMHDGALYFILVRHKNENTGAYHGTPVDRAIFNDLAQPIIDKAVQDFLGIDPNNPDEANFMPVTNEAKGIAW